jgi:hypothetical protein
MNLADKYDLICAFNRVVNCEEFEWDDVWDQSNFFAEEVKEDKHNNLLTLCIEKLKSMEKWERLFAFRIIKKSGNIFQIPPTKLSEIYEDVDYFQKISIIRMMIKFEHEDAKKALVKIKKSSNDILLKFISCISLLGMK